MLSIQPMIIRVKCSLFPIRILKEVVLIVLIIPIVDLVALIIPVVYPIIIAIVIVTPTILLILIVNTVTQTTLLTMAFPLFNE